MTTLLTHSLIMMQCFNLMYDGQCNGLHSVNVVATLGIDKIRQDEPSVLALMPYFLQELTSDGRV
jgi:hypothetical protein